MARRSGSALPDFPLNSRWVASGRRLSLETFPVRQAADSKHLHTMPRKPTPVVEPLTDVEEARLQGHWQYAFELRDWCRTHPEDREAMAMQQMFVLWLLRHPLWLRALAQLGNYEKRH